MLLSTFARCYTEYLRQAAASGGITTLIDMPLNSIPSTTTVANFKAKTDAATGKCHIDVGFWGGVVPGNQDDLLPLIEAGVKGFKCFLCDSGVDEFPMVQEDDLIKAMEKLKVSWQTFSRATRADMVKGLG